MDVSFFVTATVTVTHFIQVSKATVQLWIDLGAMVTVARHCLTCVNYRVSQVIIFILSL